MPVVEGRDKGSRPPLEIHVLGNIVIMRGSTERGSVGGGVETQQNSNVFKYIIKLPKKCLGPPSPGKLK